MFFLSLGLALGLSGCLGSEGDEGAAESFGSCQRALDCRGKPVTPLFSQAVDPLASYDPQTTCDPVAKPGVIAFRDLVLATYPCTGDSGIVRACSAGGTSEHKEGRAWDWKVTVGNPAADDFLDWLLATDAQGNRYAMLRRLGVMYMIWNKRIWGAYRPNDGWRTYTGASPHTDHVHFSFSWEGAKKKTSFWSGTAPSPDSGVPQVDHGVAPVDHGLPQRDYGVPSPDRGGAVADLGLRYDRGGAATDSRWPSLDRGGWPSGDVPGGQNPNMVSMSLVGGCQVSWGTETAPSSGLGLVLAFLGLLAWFRR